MKRYYGLIITVGIVLIVLIALNAAGTVTLDRPREDEYLPIRSSYNTGPTGTRAFYQFLEESNYQVERWRENYKNLNLAGSTAKNAALVVVGPFPDETNFDKEEQTQLQKWVARGGKLLIISRTPETILRNSGIIPTTKEKTYDLKKANPEELLTSNSDVLISQPTALTRNVRGLAISKLAARLTFHQPSEDLKAESSTYDEKDDTVEENAVPPPPPKPASSPQVHPDEILPPPPPKPAPDTSPTASGIPGGVPAAAVIDEGEFATLSAPVVHLGDAEGAVLLEFTFGKGSVLLLSDPFVIANNGIAQGSNLNLALNLVEALGGKKQKIFLDEYHHGYHSQGNAMLNYFRGTPVPWVFFQLLFVALLITYSLGKRFARPLPMPVPDRHSPLEFVGSMASLQQAAEARDLALENIYPRFKSKICRSLGLSISASPQTIVARLKSRSRIKESEVELLRVFSESERVLSGSRLDDQRLIDLVAAMRRIAAQLGSAR